MSCDLYHLHISSLHLFIYLFLFWGHADSCWILNWNSMLDLLTGIQWKKLLVRERWSYLASYNHLNMVIFLMIKNIYVLLFCSYTAVKRPWAPCYLSFVAFVPCCVCVHMLSERSTRGDQRHLWLLSLDSDWDCQERDRVIGVIDSQSCPSHRHTRCSVTKLKTNGCAGERQPEQNSTSNTDKEIHLDVTSAPVTIQAEI